MEKLAPGVHLTGGPLDGMVFPGILKRLDGFAERPMRCIERHFIGPHKHDLQEAQFQGEYEHSEQKDEVGNMIARWKYENNKEWWRGE